MRTAVGSFLLLVLAGVLSRAALGDGRVASDRTHAADPEPTQLLAATPELVDRGREIYRRRCAACHGEDGRGDGEAAYLLYPKPRNFVRGQFRFVSTWEGVPTDEDLFRSVSRGIPGSAMPSWAHLSEADRWALVHFMKSLAGEALSVESSVIEVPIGLSPTPEEKY